MVANAPATLARAAGAAVPAAPHVDPRRASAAAVHTKGWWRAQRWLLLRRSSQLGILLLFLAGPWFGLWLVKGNLSSSLTLNTLPLTDPFVLAQVIATGHRPEVAALLGAAIVIAVYALIGGRVYCSWVCPVNPVTDAAAWLRRRLRIGSGRALRASLRNWLAIAVLAASALSGVVAWEWVNPVSLTQRALIFGGGIAFAGVAAVFVFDLFIAPRGWCGHLCPMGAAYAAIGARSLLRVSAAHSSRCDDCAACYAVCPEPQVIPAALKAKDGAGPVIIDRQCTNCARCIDVCPTDVFRFTHRFDPRRD
jgi:ferredoxin-type protein NapH